MKAAAETAKQCNMLAVINVALPVALRVMQRTPSPPLGEDAHCNIPKKNKNFFVFYSFTIDQWTDITHARQVHNNWLTRRVS